MCTYLETSKLDWSTKLGLADLQYPEHMVDSTHRPVWSKTEDGKEELWIVMLT